MVASCALEEAKYLASRAVSSKWRAGFLAIIAFHDASIVEPWSGVASLRVVISAVEMMMAARSAAVAGTAVEALAAEDLFPVMTFPSVEGAAISAGVTAGGPETYASLNSVELGIT